MNQNKPKVAVMGLASINNFGDNFILKCVSYLVNEQGKYEAEIVDFEPPMNVPRAFLYYFMLIVSKIMPDKKLSAGIEFMAVKIRCKKYYSRSLKNMSGLIFGAGSFKYGTQKLWAYYSLAIETAQKIGIPVMFNAMNIQKANHNDWKCRFLLEHTNLPCVKVITSRDGSFGVERLKKEYCVRADIICKGVGDAAFWIPECYHTDKNTDTKKVGINLIYGNIFIRYGNHLTEEELLHIYCGLLRKLDEEGIEWELFTNGLKSDYDFGRKLLMEYGNQELEIRIPTSDVDLLQIIRNYKIILGARLHACICAYTLEIPFVGFIWDEKLLYFSKMAELEHLFVMEKDLTSDALFIKMMSMINSNMEHYRAKRLEWRSLTKQMIEMFLNDFLEA